jgi:hypothetical protein
MNFEGLPILRLACFFLGISAPAGRSTARGKGVHVIMAWR